MSNQDEYMGRVIDVLQRVVDLPYFKNERVEKLVWDARQLLKDHDANLPAADDVRGILAPVACSREGQ